MLGRLGLQLLCGAQIRYKCKVNGHAVFFGKFPLELSYCFDERLGLHVSHRASYLGDDNVIFAAFSKQEHATLDFIRNMRYNLYSLPKICAFALLCDDRVIYFSCRDVIGFGSTYSKKPLVVSKIEVCFRSVIGDITLSVLVRVQSARVNVDIRVKLLDCDP